MELQKEKLSLTLRGIGANEYFGAGRISFRHGNSSARQSFFSGTENEKKRFEQAKEKAAEGFLALRRESECRLSPEECEIFDIYRDLALDEDLTDEVFALIEGEKTAEAALVFASDAIAERLLLLDDEYLRDRAADIKNVAKEILRFLGESNSITSLSEDTPSGEKVIIAAEDLSPADTLRTDTKNVAGFVLFAGSKSSHTAILASSLGIPCIVGCGELDPAIDGSFAIIDAGKGILRVEPEDREIREYALRATKEEEESQKLEGLKHVTPRTKSGKEMKVFANIGSVLELESKQIESAGGCGLFRSELLFLDGKCAPTEDEQTHIYRTLISAFGERICVIRLLDIGADKVPPYIVDLGHEENPALGVRGIRFLLEEKDILKAQLRAIMRASVCGNPAVMIPMVTNTGEISAVREIMNEISAELKSEGIPHRESIPLGIMIETPASAIIAERLAEVSDFFSVGTNDLSQYTLAADRQNPSLASLIDENLESVFFLIEMAARAIHSRGGWIGVCGELAARSSLTEKFIEIGIDELSVSLPYVLKIKDKIMRLP